VFPSDNSNLTSGGISVISPLFSKALKAITAAGVLAGLAACGANSSGGNNASGSDSTVNVELWHYFSPEQSRPLNEIIQRFMAANPDVQVRAIFQGNPSQLRQKIDSALVTTPPKVPALATVYENWTTDYVNRGYLDPFQNYVDTPDGMSAADIQDFVTVFRESCTYDNKLVTVPFNKSIYMMYLNMTALREAGFTTAPQTLEEYGDAIRRTTQREGNRVRMHGAGIIPMSEAFSSLFLANGGSFFTVDGRPNFISEEAVQVMSFYRELQHPTRHLLVDTSFMSTPFGNERIAMYISTSASFPHNVRHSTLPDGSPRFDYVVAPIPAGPSGKDPRYLMQGTNLAIFEANPPEVRKAAARLISFLSEPANAAEWVTRAGYMPHRYSMLQQPLMQKAMEDDPAYALASQLVFDDKGMQEPRIPQWDGFRTEIATMVDRVINTGADPTQELQRVQQTILERLGLN
jgi:ABC-type glycerol-3-phosphate transport system substrate-binding protein